MSVRRLGYNDDTSVNAVSIYFLRGDAVVLWPLCKGNRRRQLHAGYGTLDI